MSIAGNFNLLNEFNILRIICGEFFIPHIYARIFVPEALRFFVAAKFRPAAIWMYIAFAIDHRDGTRDLPDLRYLYELCCLAGSNP